MSEKLTIRAANMDPAAGDSLEFVCMSVRLKPEVHERLRQTAYDRKVSIHSLLLEGVDHVLRQQPKPKHLRDLESDVYVAQRNAMTWTTSLADPVIVAEAKNLTGDIFIAVDKMIELALERSKQ